MFELMIWLRSKKILLKARFCLQEFTVSAAQTRNTELSYVPQCMSLTLKCVEIKGLTMEEKTGKKLVRYIFENTVVLKQLTLRYRVSPTTIRASDISKQLHTSTKRPRKCHISIH